MRKRNRMPTWFVVVLALVAIGIASSILNGGQALIIPVVLIAIVWILYKFPPNRWARGGAPRSDYQRAAAQSKKRQQAKETAAKPRRSPSPFRVIEGSKGRDDEPPTYH
ncbi:hypothetical protein SAMN05216312_104421 [Cohnella sp. OV330]|uniref:hypothetical protein n=1 Tax=Cohnella sp. OV330 TaxID=1855288 RepID=UPI0008E76A92|nr:hypothetical protein [Cohnella sp. OV330]SFB20440.1 hypothetical protein SAMN05216312_104421 [Cohnella sp. OV330]